MEHAANLSPEAAAFIGRVDDEIAKYVEWGRDISDDAYTNRAENRDTITILESLKGSVRYGDFYLDLTHETDYEQDQYGIALDGDVYERCVSRVQDFIEEARGLGVNIETSEIDDWEHRWSFIPEPNEGEEEEIEMENREARIAHYDPRDDESSAEHAHRTDYETVEKANEILDYGNRPVEKLDAIDQMFSEQREYLKSQGVRERDAWVLGARHVSTTLDYLDVNGNATRRLETPQSREHLYREIGWQFKEQYGTEMYPHIDRTEYLKSQGWIEDVGHEVGQTQALHSASSEALSTRKEISDSWIHDLKNKVADPRELDIYYNGQVDFANAQIEKRFPEIVKERPDLLVNAVQLKSYVQQQVERLVKHGKEASLALCESNNARQEIKDSWILDLKNGNDPENLNVHFSEQVDRVNAGLKEKFPEIVASGYPAVILDANQIKSDVNESVKQGREVSTAWLRDTWNNYNSAIERVVKTEVAQSAENQKTVQRSPSIGIGF